jgi:hypothetical protein
LFGKVLELFILEIVDFFFIEIEIKKKKSKSPRFRFQLTLRRKKKKKKKVFSTMNELNQEFIDAQSHFGNQEDVESLRVGLRRMMRVQLLVERNHECTALRQSKLSAKPTSFAETDIDQVQFECNALYEPKPLPEDDEQEQEQASEQSRTSCADCKLHRAVSNWTRRTFVAISNRVLALAIGQFADTYVSKWQRRFSARDHFADQHVCQARLNAERQAQLAYRLAPLLASIDYFQVCALSCAPETLDDALVALVRSRLPSDPALLLRSSSCARALLGDACHLLVCELRHKQAPPTTAAPSSNHGESIAAASSSSSSSS